MIKAENIKYTTVKEPFWGLPKSEPKLPDEVFKGRLDKTLAAMSTNGLDYLLVYADREHYSNFEYLTGFDPRFEEALLLLSKSGKAHIFLGNECFVLHKYSRIPAEGILCQALSLPNQPIELHEDLSKVFSNIGVKESDKVGLVGWKLIAPIYGDRSMSDIPSFIVESIREIVGAENATNATDLFIHPEYGIRVINTADDIAFFEYGATYASDSVQQALLNLRTGITEVELSQSMTFGAIPNSCHPMVLAEERMDMVLVSPTTNEIKLGDRLQLLTGLRGGLTNRRGFVAYSEDDISEKAKDYIENLAKPYYATVANWFESIGIGVPGGDIYNMVESTFPKEKFGWFLNPGHLTATEEWMSSPIFKDSNITLKSGMCMQMDIIPSTEPHYADPDCEDGIAIADETLRKELAEKYPDVYQRIENRRNFMINVLGIQLKPEVLPLSNITGLYRPFMLDKDRAFVVER